MCKGVCGLAMMTGLFVSVFLGALAYKLVKKTGIDKVTDPEGFQSETSPAAER